MAITYNLYFYDNIYKTLLSFSHRSVVFYNINSCTGVIAFTSFQACNSRIWVSFCCSKVSWWELNTCELIHIILCLINNFCYNFYFLWVCCKRPYRTDHSTFFRTTIQTYFIAFIIAYTWQVDGRHVSSVSLVKCRKAENWQQVWLRLCNDRLCS